MKPYLKLFLVGIILSGCATQPNPWNDVPLDESVTEAPIPLPNLPTPTIVGDHVELDATQAAQVRDYGIIARTNTEMAAEYAKAIDQRKAANTALVEAGKAQRVQAEMLREMLEDERRHNFVTKIGLYVLVIGLGVAL